MFVPESFVDPGQEENEGDLKGVVSFFYVLNVHNFNGKFYREFILIFPNVGGSKKILVGGIVNDNFIAVIFITSILKIISFNEIKLFLIIFAPS